MVFYISLLAFLIWLVLFFAWGNFWRVWEFDADRAQFPAPARWPRVSAVIPARNEASSIVAVVRALGEQEYAGEFTVLIVDDHSDDGTAELAREAALAAGAADKIRVICASELADGWTGKLWALNSGVNASGASLPDFFWFTDADVVHSPNMLQRLVSHAEAVALDLISLMVLFRAETFAERLLIPPFLYFFLMLYPPRWIADVHAKTAG